MDIQEVLIDLPVLIQSLPGQGYWILFLVFLLEGGVTGIIAGFLVSLGYFNMLPTFGLFMLEEVATDLMWYPICRYGGRPVVERIGRFFRMDLSALDSVAGHFHEHGGKTLFVGKVSIGGAGMAILLAAGLSGMNFKRYALYNTLGSVAWCGGLLVLGYFFGEHYKLVMRYLGLFGLCVMAPYFLLFVFRNRIIAFLRKVWTAAHKKWRGESSRR